MKICMRIRKNITENMRNAIAGNGIDKKKIVVHKSCCILPFGLYAAAFLWKLNLIKNPKQALDWVIGSIAGTNSAFNTPTYQTDINIWQLGHKDNKVYGYMFLDSDEENGSYYSLVNKEEYKIDKYYSSYKNYYIFKDDDKYFEYNIIDDTATTLPLENKEYELSIGEIAENLFGSKKNKKKFILQ